MPTSRRSACPPRCLDPARRAGRWVRRPDRRTDGGGPGTTTTTVAPTTTTLPPLTAKELAWLKAIPTVGRKIEKSIEAITDLTPSGMARLATTFRSCTRELVRGGASQRPPAAGLCARQEGVQGVRQGGGVLHHRRKRRHPVRRHPGRANQSKAIDCGFAAPGKGGIVLADAENKGMEIKAEAG